MKINPWLVGSALIGIGLGVLAAIWSDQPVLVPAGVTLSVRSHSRLTLSGDWEPGGVVRSGKLAATVAQQVSEALLAIPLDLRPIRPILEIEPRYADGVRTVDWLEYHRAARAIIVGPRGTTATRSMWLHELAHVRVAGSRPRGALALRLSDAVEEGVADYFAAVVSGDPVLGQGAEQRDLRSPPRASAAEWASLAYAGFDTHRAGWRFAAQLYELDPRGGSLLRDVVACLDGESALGAAVDSPAAVVGALLAACPEQGRPRLSRLLAAWLPPELYSAEIPT